VVATRKHHTGTIEGGQPPPSNPYVPKSVVCWHGSHSLCDPNQVGPVIGADGKETGEEDRCHCACHQMDNPEGNPVIWTP
jgi:hypothetical protein